MFCPVCKYEYVEGIKICPDCKSALVESLDDISVNESDVETDGNGYDEYYPEEDSNDFDEDDNPNLSRINLPELIAKVKSGEISKEEFLEVVNSLRQTGNLDKPYVYIKDQYIENKSSAVVLCGIGLLGVALLLLNFFGLIHLPLNSSTSILVNVVLYGLFIIFILCGIKSAFKAKSLKPEVSKEAELIEEAGNFLKEQKANGAFVINNENIGYEEEGLFLNELCVSALKNKYPDAREGFAFYVADKFYSELFEDNEN